MFKSRRQNEVAALRAEVDALLARLASDIGSLDPGQDPGSRQAMSDATERYNSVGSLMSRATSAGELMVARRVVIEGLTATRFIRDKQGLPLGGDLPDPGVPAVGVPTPVVHEGSVLTAHPEYHPDRPHYFGGGAVGSTQAPAGYYRTPFWQKAAAIGGALVAGDLIGNAMGDLLDGGSGGYGEGFGDGDTGGGWSGGDDGGAGGW